ncbi:P-loop containing nucleoside triphosphate hydrolase protein, partial [Aureobasidium melanogenum]
MSSTAELPQFLRLKAFDLPHFNLQASHGSFSSTVVATAILKGCSKDDLDGYLRSCPREVASRISDNVYGGHPVIFYAAKRNDLDIMELLLEYGADPQAKSPGPNIPLLAATIMWTKWTHKNVEKIVALLLSYGADPHCIPEHMWSTYTKTPAEWYSSDDAASDLAIWAKTEHRIILTETLNLTIRYHLNRASFVKPVAKRTRQLARLHGCHRILNLPFHIVGQDYALDVAMLNILQHATNMQEKLPLVLAFAGLSGHGKTELATSLGNLLNSDLCNIDMSKIKHSWSLFGGAAPMIGYEKGTILNNYLAAHTGQRCVVFLDEFDKTEQEVRDSLLTLLDSGVGMDLRSNTVTDVTNSIWILASNKGDHLISSFYEKNLEGKSDRKRRQVPIEPLERDLSRLFLETYTPAVTGRIQRFLPFFPFSQGEAAVVNHKFLTAFSDNMRRPIDLHSKDLRSVGHLHLSLINDGDICESLAENYIQELGARSIRNGIRRLANELFVQYITSDEEVAEAVNSKPHVHYELQLCPVGNTFKVAVRQAGTTLIPSD